MKINKILLSGRMRNCVLTVLILTSWTLVAAQTRIMPIGDSITWGKSATDQTAENEGYRKILHDQLTA